MIASVISFFLGTLCLHFFSELPSLGLTSFVVTVLTLLLLIPGVRKTKFYLIFIFSVGFNWCLFNAQSTINQSLPTYVQKKPLEITGVISSIPHLENGIQHFEIKIQNVLTTTGSSWKSSGRIKLRWYDGPEDLKVGEVWRLTVKLKRPRAYSNPGSVDIERTAFVNRIMAEGTVIDKLPTQRLQGSRIEYCIDRVRSWLRDKILYHLEHKPFAGIMVALIVGVTHDISSEQWSIFRNTGTAHLVAISGLHIGLVAGFTFFIVKMICRRIPVRLLTTPIPLIAASVCCVMAFVYALLAGFSLPTKRAVIMIILFMTGILTKRVIPIWRSYFLALSIILLLDPLSPLMPGFWLSFGAVGIIIYGMQGRLQPNNLWWRWGRAQWVVFLGLSPITLAIFNMSSFVSPFANLVAIPWVSFLVVPLGLSGTLSLIIHEKLAGYCFSLAEKSVSILWPFLKMFNQVTSPSWLPSSPSSFYIALSMIGILLWLAPSGFPGRWLGLMWLLPLFLMKVSTPENNTVHFTLLDVGQGLSAIVETKHHVLVFDTGPKLNSHFDTGEKVVLPFLATRGYQRIDTLIISHGDNDHMGGAHSILKHISVDKILSSEPKLFSGPNVGLCLANQRWEWDGVKFEILHPISLNTRKRNDHSCVLRVQVGEQSVLLTGDIEITGEQQILKRTESKSNHKNIYPNNPSLKSTILVVPHHGSRTSSSLEFIRAVSPRYALIPAGYLNGYGHPKPDIVERYQREGITVLDTIQHGAISFVLQDEAEVASPAASHGWRVVRGSRGIFCEMHL